MFKQIGISFALIALGQAATLTFIEKARQDWAVINYRDDIEQQGKNVAVGFMDSGFNLQHPSLAGKSGDTDGSNTLSQYPKNASSSSHGTHAASVAIGNNYDSNKIHGIAPKAGLYGLAYLNDNYPYDSSKSKDDIMNFFKEGQVKVVNNSWVRNYYPFINKKINDVLTFENIYTDFSSSPVTAQFVMSEARQDRGLEATIELAKSGVLQVYSAGNEAQLSPAITASLPTYDESLKAWVSVGAIDTDYITMGDKITIKPQTFTNLQKAQGSQNITNYIIGIRGGITSFTNNFKGSQAYGILAPGYNVGGANAYYNSDIAKQWSGTDYDRYVLEFWAGSGTSYSAPFVTGAAALVAEKYPFADGRLLADIILSTANSNVELPRIIVKQTPMLWGTVEKYNEYHSYYTIIYTDGDDESKFKNRDQVKNDLIKEFSIDDNVAEEILNHIIHNKDDGAFATYLTQEEIIGQGILDVEKALKGLGKVDANRLSKSEIKTSQISGEKQALYPIDTDGHDAEFSNNIKQVKWKKEWHFEGAENSSKDLETIEKIGLEKKGQGTLTLSGRNTYLGDTIVSGGTLRLTGSITSDTEVTANGKFMLGDYANASKKATITGNVLNLGTFAGIGLVKGDFDNQGILRAGFFSEYDESINNNSYLEIDGKLTQKSKDAQIELAFTKKTANNQAINSKLSAKEYDITSGNLLYVPLHNSYDLIQNGDKIDISFLGNFDAQVQNFTNVNVKSTNLLDFQLSADKKSFTAIAKGSTPTTPDGGNTGGGSGGSSGGESTGGSSGGSGGGSTGGGTGGETNPSNPSTPDNPREPQQPDTPGQGTGSETSPSNPGQGTQQPSQPQQPTQPSQPNDNTGNQGNTGTGSQNQNNNQNNNQAEQIAQQQATQAAQQQAVAAAILAAAPVTPSSPDAPIKALQGLLNNAAILSPASTAALAQLDNLPSEAFSDAINAMKNTPTNTNIDAIDTMQKDLTIKNALFLMDPASTLGTLNTASSVFAPTAAFGDEYLGKVDDVFIKTEVSAGIAYRRTDHDDYKQNSYLLDLQGKKALNDNTLLGGYIGLSHSKTEDELSDIKSNMFSLGLSLNHSFENFGVLLGASAGMSFNHYEQSIKYLSNAKSDANYKNYFANFQGGIYKSFKLSENLNLTPIALLDYSVIRQDSFSQSGALAKNYEAKTTHFGRGWLGANLVYNTELDNNWKFNTSLFAFYWRKFNHKDINQNLSFVEASNQKFLANTSRSERQGFYGGVAFGASKGNKFFRISISDEKARAYNQYEIMLRAGISF